MILSTHSSKLERWIGKDQAEAISNSMKDWYGPPIGVGGIPGAVFACKGGDFRGPIKSGQFMNVVDFSVERLKRIWRNSAKRSAYQLNTGFSSLSDLISEATAGGKKQDLFFNKTGPTGVIAVSSSLWGLGVTPAAGANASAAPGGDAPTKDTLGAMYFNNPEAPDTTHFVRGDSLASLQNTLLLYDRIFQVDKTMSSTGTEAVTGVPTRYQNTTPGTPNHAGGNFLFITVGATPLSNTAHNWTVCKYYNQVHAAESTLPSFTGVAAAIVRRLDHGVGSWFVPLAAGDVGIQQLTQMQCSGSVTGVVNFVIGHPIAFMPCPIANMICILDGINTAFNLTRIFDDAALALLEICKPAATATNYTGSITIVSG